MTSLDLMTETCVWCIYLKQPPDLMRLWFQCRDESRMVPRRVAFLNLEFYDSNPASKLIDFLASVFSSVVETHSCPVRVEWMFVLNSEYFFFLLIDWPWSNPLWWLPQVFALPVSNCCANICFFLSLPFLLIKILKCKKCLKLSSLIYSNLTYLCSNFCIEHRYSPLFFCLFFWGELSVRCKEWCGEDIQHFVLFFWGAVWDLCKDDVEKI